MRASTFRNVIACLGVRMAKFLCSGPNATCLGYDNVFVRVSGLYISQALLACFDAEYLMAMSTFISPNLVDGLWATVFGLSLGTMN